MSNNHDVIIVGGGMVGASLAAALGQANLRVAVIENGDAPEAVAAEAEFGLRISSLNLAAVRLLEDIRAWPLIPDARRCRFRRIEAWDEHDSRGITFDADALDLPEFGYFVENRLLCHAVWQRLKALPAVTLHTRTAPQALRHNGDQAELELASGKTLTASLVVGADGASSTIRDLARITTVDHGYQQRALIINVATRLPQQDVSWQRFTPDGPQAMLPLPGHRASLVWYGNPERTREREQLDDETLRDTIDREFPTRLGGVEAVLGRASFPIRRRHARQYSTDRTVLVGDAAHVIHPLAGQGLNLGLQDAATLASELIATTTRSGDPGERQVLARYARRRRPQVLAMIAATEGFHHLFTGPAPLRMVGNAALGLANRVTPGKRLMMRIALGLSPG
ncbi:UbiH/UbiF/VisC/COQ6 family ubiquinone biosynthesis hydroxylase [Methylonatrum kenyense]|uniref:UbiH/UbiF/VisC/COQ6 family ubiquinone biosynthesis hydroxylase n=1 Tax=Methylonatrum kenyense TaxID=455253 RepID=UPI0020BF1F56|nr:UbiH/UbiF/VisC/COQ6 family ubiquinone biosynthesis hydroxylase [Methylonatrum kenyense]MCK8515038.1 UbiH/UbiF/VisC/COQ6 family ubiquinone biosynthesis hydroxylase [Methylonatrum kenyense]